MTGQSVGRLVDHLFRQQSRRMVATLTRIFGAHDLELVEEVVQDALLRALQQWPRSGVPENPTAWLIQTAKHRALDAVRRRALHDRSAVAIAAALHGEAAFPAAPAGELTDDELCMMFMCCHPSLAADAQVALMLNVVGGFSAREVARSFLLEEATAAQRLVRAKRRLRDAGVRFEMPAADELPRRLGAVLDALYLIFTAGYSARAGDAPVRWELCAEALRLTRLLSEHERCGRPETHALRALMCLQAARLDTRTDAAGELLLLEEQDRSRWDRVLANEGVAQLQRSASGDVLSAFHVQAAIAAVHTAAPDWAATDWQSILKLYDQLMALQPTPVVALNRAVALAMVEGAHAALAELVPLCDDPALARYVLLPATLAELCRRTGDAAGARAHLLRALELECSDSERRLLKRRLAELAAA
jgi:RNA polymerase sigma-70 factor, ECF subfamily